MFHSVTFELQFNVTSIAVFRKLVSVSVQHSDTAMNILFVPSERVLQIYMFVKHISKH